MPAIPQNAIGVLTCEVDTISDVLYRFFKISSKSYVTRGGRQNQRRQKIEQQTCKRQQEGKNRNQTSHIQVNKNKNKRSQRTPSREEASGGLRWIQAVAFPFQ